jgi:hypothetical protein
MINGRFWSKTRGAATVKLIDATGKVVKEVSIEAVPGFNTFQVGAMLAPRATADPNKVTNPKTLAEALADPYSRPTYIEKGAYKLEVTVNGQTATVDVTVS